MAEKHPPSPKREDDTLPFGRLRASARNDGFELRVVLCGLMSNNTITNTSK